MCTCSYAIKKDIAKQRVRSVLSLEKSSKKIKCSIQCVVRVTYWSSQPCRLPWVPWQGQNQTFSLYRIYRIRCYRVWVRTPQKNCMLVNRWFLVTMVKPSKNDTIQCTYLFSCRYSNAEAMQSMDAKRVCSKLLLNSFVLALDDFRIMWASSDQVCNRSVNVNGSGSMTRK